MRPTKDGGCAGGKERYLWSAWDSKEGDPSILSFRSGEDDIYEVDADISDRLVALARRSWEEWAKLVQIWLQNQIVSKE